MFVAYWKFMDIYYSALLMFSQHLFLCMVPLAGDDHAWKRQILPILEESCPAATPNQYSSWIVATGRESEKKEKRRGSFN
jgi:hypothetical protein